MNADLILFNGQFHTVDRENPRATAAAIDQGRVGAVGTGGEALAFGPGRLAGGIGSDQALTLAGHRDTHFAFLETLNSGDPLTVELTDGSQQRFQVSSQQVINSQQHPLHIPRDNQQLVLITCYPFDAITAGGPLRYVIPARA